MVHVSAAAKEKLQTATKRDGAVPSASSLPSMSVCVLSLFPLHQDRGSFHLVMQFQPLNKQKNFGFVLEGGGYFVFSLV